MKPQPVVDAYGENRTAPPAPDVQFSAIGIYESARFKMLDWRERFYKCTQHDHKIYDFDGRMTKAGEWWGTQDFIGASLPNTYVPMVQRRPSVPYRLGRIVVNRFTSLLFGRGRWPKIDAVGDTDAEDYANALIKAMDLPAVMIRARGLGGSCGTVGLSWKIIGGNPRVSVHSGKFLHVFEWADREDGIPAHVMQLYKTERDVFDHDKKKQVRKTFWVRRDWTESADIVFEEVEVRTNAEPEWVIASIDQHDDGFAHFIWIENLPEEDDLTIDGQPDYEGVYDPMNHVDILNSAVMKGGTNTVEPTLILKMEQDEVEVVRRGSDTAIVVGPNGDARYLVIDGASLEAGGKLIDRQAQQILDVVSCVIPDPDKLAAAGMSSIAIKAIYQPMLDKCDVMRTQYGRAIVRLVSLVMSVVRSRVSVVVVDENGEEQPVEEFLNLPPRIVEEEEIGPDGAPTGEMRMSSVERTPGTSENFELVWPPYFPVTDADRQSRVASISTAAGAKPILSQHTAVEQMAAIYEVDPVQEWQRVVDQTAADAQMQAGMFPSFGGEVGSIDELPPGATAPAPPLEEDAEELA